MDNVAKYRRLLSRIAADPRATREELISSVSRQLASLMKSRPLTAAGLAAELGVTRQWVSRALGGGENLTLDTIWRLATALDAEVRITVGPRETRQASEATTQSFESKPQQPLETWPVIGRSETMPRAEAISFGDGGNTVVAARIQPQQPTAIS